MEVFKEKSMILVEMFLLGYKGKLENMLGYEQPLHCV